MAVAAEELPGRYAAVRRVMTGFGRTSWSSSQVIGMPSIGRLQELIAARRPAAWLPAGPDLATATRLSTPAAWP